MERIKINPDARALEESFFAKENTRLLEKMREERRTREVRESLRAVVRIKDDEFLDRLIVLGVGPETVLALALVPLIAVAWADGKLDKREREAILRAAEERGVAPDSPGRPLLETWLNHKPEAELFQTWKRYMRAIWDQFTEEERGEMRRNGLEWANEVARAAGGFLGAKKISPAERAVLDELEAFLA